MVLVQLGAIQSGGWSDNVGIFTGQNIQNAWDSHAPSINSYGAVMGDLNLSFCAISWMRSQHVIGQPVQDQDIKGNHSPMSIR